MVLRSLLGSVYGSAPGAKEFVSVLLCGGSSSDGSIDIPLTKCTSGLLPRFTFYLGDVQSAASGRRQVDLAPKFL